MKLTNNNYYSQEANSEYLSVSQYKDFCGTLGYGGCEARALAKLKNEWVEEPSTAMLIGSYVDAHFENTLQDFKEKNQQIYTAKGDLKKDFQKAEEIIKRVKKDDMFMLYMSGKKQVIMTAELFGAKWKIKMDSYHPKVCISDLKIIKDIHERFWVKDFGFTNFVEYWGYDLQLAIYQQIVEKKTGYKLPCFIPVCDKGKTPELELIGFRQEDLDYALLGVKGNTWRILKLKKGELEPDRCCKCDYCKSTKKITGPVHFKNLIEI